MNNKNINNHSDENDYSFAEFYFIIKKHLKIIFIILSLTILASIMYTLLVKPTYESKAELMISENQNSNAVIGMTLDTDRNYIENEIQILKSRTTSEMVVEKLLNSEYRNDLYLFNTKSYKSPYYRKYVSFGLLDKFQDTITIPEDYDNYLIPLYAKKLRKRIEVTNKRNTDALYVKVKGSNPNECQLILDTLLNVYEYRDREWATEEMSNLKQFLIAELNSTSIKLDSIDLVIRDFQEKSKIFTTDANTAALLSELQNYESIYFNYMAKIDINTQKEKYINTQLTDKEKKFTKNVTNTINQRLTALKSEMEALEVELISSIAKYGNNHEAVINLERKLEVVKNKLEAETEILVQQETSVADPISYRQSLVDSLIQLEFENMILKSSANSYDKIIQRYDSTLKNLPQQILDYTKHIRAREIYASSVKFLEEQINNADLGKASKLDKLRVYDSAELIKKPIQPSLPWNLFIGIVCGLVISAITILLIEIFDNTIKSLEQIERKGLSILSIIPSISSNRNNRSLRKRYLNKNLDVSKLQRRLITHEDPKSPISEAYRGLRTSLMYSKNESKCNFILASSSGPGEGKTTTIANLAITYANLGKKTLLVDTDLRKSVVHNVFNIDKTPGLTSYLSTDMKLDKIINNTEIENLDIVTSGITPPNPSELLDSEKMNSFIDDVSKNYDIVLFDSPPLIAVTDAYVIMKHIDQFILVVRPGVTEKGALDRVVSALDQAELSITGVVFNAVTEQHSYGAGYYYNYYQYYYGDDK